MQQSNSYIIIFSLILTIVLGGLLSGASQVLGPKQRIAIDLDTKKQILGAIPQEKGGLSEMDGPAVLARYAEVIESVVADYQGNLVTTDAEGKPVVAEKVNIEKNYKLKPEDRLYPVFKYSANGQTAYILPIFGAGLWDAIWGYVAVTPDYQTLKGISLDHRGETPGLGARITSPQIQGRYVGKSIVNESGELVSVEMIKGENNDPSKLGPTKVDGMAGATLTAVGVNNMLEAYLGYYKNYFEKNVEGASALTMNR